MARGTATGTATGDSNGDGNGDGDGDSNGRGERDSNGYYFIKVSVMYAVQLVFSALRIVSYKFTLFTLSCHKFVILTVHNLC